MKKILTLSLLFLGIFAGQAQTRPEPVSGSVLVEVNGQGQNVFSLPAEEEAARAAVQRLLAGQPLPIVNIRSAASPEGPVGDNEKRSAARGEAARQLVKSWMPELPDSRIRVHSVGEDYETLVTLLQSSDIPGAAQAIRVIETVPTWVTEGGRIVSSRKKQVMDIRGGETWNRMREDLFPLLRGTRIDIRFGEPEPEEEQENRSDSATTNSGGLTFGGILPSGAAIIDRQELFYRVSRTDLDPNYLDNAERMDKIHILLNNPTRVVDSVVVYAWASPEGPYANNVRLSRQRAETARNYILATNDIDPGLVKISPMQENWIGLLEEVENNYRLDNRDAVLRILRDNSLSDPQRKQRLKDLDQGVTYRYLIQHLMPRLRNATFVCTWSRPVGEALPKAGRRHDHFTAPAEMVSDLTAPVRDFTVHPSGIRDVKHTVFALKTNLLYDAALMTNIGIEVPFRLGAQKFSFEYEHYFPWWILRDNRTCIQYLSTGPELRWWFAPRFYPETASRQLRDALTGHFVGAHAKYIKTDLQWDRLGNYQCYIWTAGLTYGFALPVFKHCNLEFSLSAGYARIRYQHYIPTDDWQTLLRDRTKAGTLHYFGPTELDVTLTVPFLVTRTYKPKGGVL